MTTMVNVEKLGKQYRLGQNTAGYGRLTESLSNALRRTAGCRTKRHIAKSGRCETRRSRSGKARSWGYRTERRRQVDAAQAASARHVPTEGRAEIRGRVGSLLEVGTGFHQELTGRENVYPQRRDPGNAAVGDSPAVRRDRGFRRGRELHRHAGQALLKRHGPAARLRSGGFSRAGGPARRRGARRWRPGVPEEVPRPDRRGQPGGRAHGALCQPRSELDPLNLLPARFSSTTARSSGDGPSANRS